MVVDVPQGLSMSVLASESFSRSPHKFMTAPLKDWRRFWVLYHRTGSKYGMLIVAIAPRGEYWLDGEARSEKQTKKYLCSASHSDQVRQVLVSEAVLGIARQKCGVQRAITASIDRYRHHRWRGTGVERKQPPRRRHSAFT